MILLLQVCNDIENGVHVVRRGGHRQTSGGTGGAVDEEIILWESHVHACKHERDGWNGDWNRIAGVETT